MSEHNPFAPPDDLAATAPAEETLGGAPIATQGRRLATFLIDSVIIRILATIAGFAIGFMYAANRGGPVPQSEMVTLQLMGAAAGLTVTVLYFILLEAALGITIGKLITGTRVVNADGGDAGFGQIVGRSFARMIPFEPLSFLFGDKTTGWHDSLSGTRVVYTR